MTVKAFFILAAALPAAAAQPSAATAPPAVSGAGGAQDSLNLTTTTSVAAVSPANGTTADMPDVDVTRGTPMMSPEDNDQTDGVQAPAVISPGPAEEEGAARLVGRVDVNGYATGRLQVFCDGAWGSVCSSNFDDVDAAVACRQLGFVTGVRSIQGADLPEAGPPFVLENLGCTGSESRLMDCLTNGADGFVPPAYEYTYFFDDRCDPFRQQSFAHVVCGTSDTASQGDPRLANGATAADGSAAWGRLEIFYAGGWGTVCDSAVFGRRTQGFPTSLPFTQDSVDVACRQLGFQEGIQGARLEDLNEDSTERVPFALTGLTCNGSEATLTSCPDFELGDAPRKCLHRGDVHLVCFNGPNPAMDGATRLEDGSADPSGQWEYGRLEIFARGFWSNVCNNGRFTPDAAQVACRALGYGGGAALRFTPPSTGFFSPILSKNLPVALAGVDCDGNEAAISECQSSNNLIMDCDDITGSTVLACANSAPGCAIEDGMTEGSVRLRGGFGTPCDPVYTGFIEILHDDEWGAICTEIRNVDPRSQDRGAEDNLVADVVCRQLGFPHGTRVDALTTRSPPPVSDYDYSDYDYYYDYENSSRQEDYVVAEEAEEPSERFWLSSGRDRRVICSGSETALTQCDLGNGFLQDNAGCSSNPVRLTIACRQFPVVEALEEVQTPDAEEGDLRLIDQGEIDNWTTGLLQVFFEGSWSQVCAGSFNAPDANVACRQLGFGAGTAVPLAQALSTEQLEEFVRTQVFPEVAISDVQCTGTEERLLDCGVDRSYDDYASNYVGPDRGCINSDTSVGFNGGGLVLGCVTAPLQGPAAGAEGDFRIANQTAGSTPGTWSGVLEVFHAGAWGTLCSGDFGITVSTAELICRDMGFVNGTLQDLVGPASVRPPWLSGIRCSEAEGEPAACPRSAFGEAETCGAAQRIICFMNRQGTGDARLVGGSADPGGAWAYGVLEVGANSVYNFLLDATIDEALGRRGAEVACRSFGFATGGKLNVGARSPFIVSSDNTALNTIDAITCDGSERQLGDCTFELQDSDPSLFRFGDLGVVAIMCTTPSGCSDPVNPPAEGAVRLVPLNGTASATQACDAVHLGAVELFRDGRWGRICAGRFGRDLDKFTLDAQVVCRQLGFPFGSLMDVAEVSRAFDYVEYGEGEEELVWATSVACTGKEARLLDCVFPQAFGDDYPDFGDVEPAPAVGTAAPPMSNGVPSEGCDRAEYRLAVICRNFEIPESDTIKR